MGGAVPIGRRSCWRSCDLASRVAFLLVLMSGAALAENLENIDGLSDAEVERRYDFIAERLDRHRLHSQIWHWSWTAINGGALVGLSVAGGLTDTNADRVSFFSQAALAGVGLVDLYLLRPLPALNGAARLRELPARTPAERRARLVEAQRLLRRAARRPGEWRELWPHFGNLLVNAAVGVGVWQAGSGTDGLISGLSGALLGEVYIFSQPSGWRKDLRDYHRFTGSAVDSGGRWSLIAMPGGMGIRYEF